AGNPGSVAGIAVHEAVVVRLGYRRRDRGARVELPAEQLTKVAPELRRLLPDDLEVHNRLRHGYSLRAVLSMTTVANRKTHRESAAQSDVPGGGNRHYRAGADPGPARAAGLRRRRLGDRRLVRPLVRGADAGPPVRRAVSVLPVRRPGLAAAHPSLASGPAGLSDGRSRGNAPARHARY